MIKSLIVKLFSKFGLDLIKKESYKKMIWDYNFLQTQYTDTIKEAESLFHAVLFKELPVNVDNRITLMQKLLGTQVSEAFHILNYLNKSLKVEGDICEFGIAQGSTSALMANEIKHTNKNLWLFDSFKGLSKPTEKDLLKDDVFNLGSIEAYHGAMANSVDSVKQKLTDISFPFDKVRIIPGFIEETIKLPNLVNKVCFAYVDFDLYEPILVALIYLDKVLEKNGYIIVDDYDFFSTGVKTAVEEFLEPRKENYNLILPFEDLGHFCILEKIK